MEKIIEIPDGYEARIEGNKVILEPKESEDERISEWLIKFVEVRLPDAAEFEPEYRAALAWLERQKEQQEIPLMNGDTDLYFDEWKQQFQGNPTKRQCFEEGIRYSERKQNSQKPAEWNEEDEKMRNNLIELLIRLSAKTRTDSTSINYSYPREIDWLKSLPKRLHLQPKQGWSETDKQMLENIIEVIGETCPDNYTASFITKMLSWLKSLRPQPHWKPSEEQMKALFAASERNDKLGAILNNLYNDLKKL